MEGSGWRRGCQDRDVLFFHCQLVGSKASLLPGEGEVKDSPDDIQDNRQSGGDSPIIPVKVNGNAVSACLDSGSSMLLIKKSLCLDVLTCMDFKPYVLCSWGLQIQTPSRNYGGGTQPEVSIHHGGSGASPSRHAFWAETAGPGELPIFA